MKPALRIDWSAQLDSGLDEMDEQHHVLVGLLNSLGVQYARGARVGDLYAIFCELERYAVYHFDAEEALMRENGVGEDDYRKHCRSHRAFVVLIRRARGLVASNPDDVVRQLTAYLLKWLVFHIGGEDKRMAHAVLVRRGTLPDGGLRGPELDGGLIGMVSELYDELGQRTLEVIALNARLREELERSQRLAHFDVLTGLPNRILFRSRAEQAFADARLQHEKLALLYLDLDRFKPINDTHGHDVGDALLCELARRLQSCVRDNDIVCRQGGDEFLVLLTAFGDDDQACVLARRIVAAVSETYALGDLRLEVSASIGIAFFPEHGDDVDTLVTSADVAMYLAKNEGGNHCVTANNTRCPICH